MFFYLKLRHKSKEDERAWHDSYGDKNMVNFIANTRKKKKSHVDVTSIFSEKLRDFQLARSSCTKKADGRLLPQTLAPQREQLKKDAGAQKTFFKTWDYLIETTPFNLLI